MPPRRGGGAGAEQVGGAVPGGPPKFPDPPVKRVQPWNSDNRTGTDIVAGRVNESGVFEGVVITDVQLTTLLRYFQLGRAFMPNSMPIEVEGVGKTMMEGYPTLIVTREGYGRQRDTGSGPVRNAAVPAIWGVVRQIRAQNPQMHITCVDAPVNVSHAQLAKVFQPPLDQYLELSFYDGSWYIQELKSTPEVAKQLREVQRKKSVFKVSRADGGQEKKKTSLFDGTRKAFPWRQDPKDENHSSLVWTLVHSDEEYVQQPKVDLLDEVSFTGPGNVHAKILPDFFKKDSDELEERKVVELLEMAFLASAGAGDVEGPEELFQTLDESLKRKGLHGQELQAARLHGASEMVKLYTEEDDKNDEAGALMMLMKMQTGRVEPRKRVKSANDLLSVYQHLSDTKKQLEAVRLIVDAQINNYDYDEAIATTKEAQAHFKKEEDAEAEIEAITLAVNVQWAKGDYEEAFNAASSAQAAFEKAKDKKQEAAAFVIVARTRVMGTELAEGRAAYEKAVQLYKEIGEKKLAASTMEALCKTVAEEQDFSAALKVAREMRTLAKEASAKREEASSCTLIANAHMQAAQQEGLRDAASEEEMVQSAKDGLRMFEELGDEPGIASAKNILAGVLLQKDDYDEALPMAKQAEASFRSLGDRVGLTAALMLGARASLTKGNLHSAMWDAKQAWTNAHEMGDAWTEAAASDLIGAVLQMDSSVCVGPELTYTHSNMTTGV